jgi:hypothetical protein
MTQPRPRRWTEEEERKMLALRSAGKNQRVMARQLDRTEMAVNARMAVVAARKRKALAKGR